MRSLLLAAVATSMFATGATAAVMTVGGGYAKSCYAAAQIQDARRTAVESCDKALAEQSLTPDDRVATLVNRGIIHLKRQDLARADRDFDHALALDSTQAEAWLNKAILGVRHGRSAEALPLVEKALANNTRSPALAYFVRAVALEDTGQIAAAYRDLQRARQLAPKWHEPVIELKRYKVRQL